MSRAESNFMLQRADLWEPRWKNISRFWAHFSGPDTGRHQSENKPCLRTPLCSKKKENKKSCRRLKARLFLIQLGSRKTSIWSVTGSKKKNTISPPFLSLFFVPWAVPYKRRDRQREKETSSFSCFLDIHAPEKSLPGVSADQKGSCFERKSMFAYKSVKQNKKASVATLQPRKSQQDRLKTAALSRSSYRMEPRNRVKLKKRECWASITFSSKRAVHGFTLLKHHVRQPCRKTRGETIRAIYVARPANDETRNSIWFQTGICARTPSKWNGMLIVLARIVFLRQMMVYTSSFAARAPQIAPIGPSRALRESWCTGIFSSAPVPRVSAHALSHVTWDSPKAPNLL